LRIGVDTTVGSGADLQRLIRLDLVESTGAAGTIGFSRSVDPIIDVNLSCTSNGCTLPGNPLPGFVVFRTAPGPLTIVLRDAAGAVAQTISLP
jgi:hypothetical protein